MAPKSPQDAPLSPAAAPAGSRRFFNNKHDNFIISLHIFAQKSRPLRRSLQKFLVCFYSLRSASTGSRLAAAEAGISPEMRVSATLMATMMSASYQGSEGTIY